MITNEIMQQALTTVIENLENEKSDIKKILQNYDIAIGILSDKRDTFSVSNEPPISKPEIAKKDKISPTDYTILLIERMCQEKVTTITHKWVMDQWQCNYHAAAKRVQRAIQKKLLVPAGKGVYRMHPDVIHDVTANVKASSDTVDVKKLVDILMSYGKGLRGKSKKINGAGTEKPVPTQPSATRNTGDVSRAILQEAGKPLHGKRDLYPELIRRGVRVAPNSVGKILSTIVGIRKTAPNTWALDQPPQETSNTTTQAIPTNLM